MPGIDCGDLGPKLGFHGKDNGWLTLTNVRVPRDQLLQRFIKVDRDGSFSVEGDLRILYSTMLWTRCQIVAGSGLVMSVGNLITLRYSAVRRQFRNISG